jgi:hypothetical protein
LGKDGGQAVLASFVIANNNRCNRPATKQVWPEPCSARFESTSAKDDKENVMLTPAAPTLATAFVFRLSVDVFAPVTVGETGLGVRRQIAIAGGELSGPGMSGRILPGGADFQIIRPSGLIDLVARYVVEMDDGAHIYVENTGIRTGPREALERLQRGEAVDPGLIYFRTVPRFETGSDKYRWLMEAVFIASAQRHQRQVIIDVYKVP